MLGGVLGGDTSEGCSCVSTNGRKEVLHMLVEGVTRLVAHVTTGSRRVITHTVQADLEYVKVQYVQVLSYNARLIRHDCRLMHILLRKVCAG